MIQRLTVMVLLMLASEGGALAEPQAEPPGKPELVQVVLRGLQESREQWRTGVFRATGKRYEDRDWGEPPLEGKVEFYGLFDSPAGKFRFDSDDVAMIDDKPGRYRAKLVLTREGSLTWSDSTPDRIKAAGANARPREMATMFDIRCLGLMLASSFREMNLRLLPEVLAGLSQRKVISLAEERGGQIVRITSQLTKERSDVQMTVWFDRLRGCSPVQMEFVDPQAGFRQACDVSWKQIAGAWVPQTFCQTSYYRQGRVRSRLTLTFSWESVNAKIPEERFTPQGLGLPDETAVVHEK